MRLVCIADTHMFHDDLRGALALPDGDVLIHAGDLGRAGDLDELTEAHRFLAAQPHKHKIVVAGNHDFLFQDEPAVARALFADLTYLEDSGCEIDGVRFWGSPWTPVFFDWAFMLPRGAPLAERWARIPVHVDVLVTHGPPHGVLDAVRDQRRVGCEALRARVLDEVRPRVHLFGHIHEGRGEQLVDVGGRQIRFVNCTTNECELPAMVVDL